MNNLPNFLKKFQKELDSYKREFLKIKPVPLDNDLTQDSLELQQSKFLGNPFFPETEEYPKDSKGQYMVLITQLNFYEIPQLDHFPKNGILQLYFSPNWDDNDEYKIIYFKESHLNQKSITDYSFIDKDHYSELPIEKIHKLEFTRLVENGSSEDSQFDFTFGKLDFWDYHDSLNEIQQEEFTNYFNGFGHKLGGYAEFAQEDPRDYDSKKKNDIQLLQIDADDHIMFGDSGLGHIFISKKNIEALNFKDAYFDWDCY